MNKDELLQQYQELDKLRIAAIEKSNVALQQYAEMDCPYKVGEIVIIEGCSFNGKRGVIKKVGGSIGWSIRGSNPEWYVEGIVLKADGTESKHWFKFFRHDIPNKESEGIK